MDLLPPPTTDFWTLFFVFFSYLLGTVLVITLASIYLEDWWKRHKDEKWIDKLGMFIPFSICMAIVITMMVLTVICGWK